MIVRDRNRPSMVIWGVRVNESANEVELYRRTTALAKSLDGSRPASGSMTSTSTKNWREDVFAMDDYHANPDGSVGIHPPLPDVPYMLAETVGQFNYATGKGFDAKYRRAGRRGVAGTTGSAPRPGPQSGGLLPAFCGGHCLVRV